MESMWRKAKLALGLNHCVYAPSTLGDASPSDEPSLRSSRPALASPASSAFSVSRAFSKSGSRSSKKTCSICLAAMKPGHGHALFTAECSHSFHFHCIASSVKHGNHVCPVCRAKWKDIPVLGSLSSEFPHGRARVNPVNLQQDEGNMNILRPLPRAISSNRQHYRMPVFQDLDTSIFDDDEPLDSLSEVAKESPQGCIKTVEIKTFPEFSEIVQSSSEENFTILLHLKAPLAQTLQTSSGCLQDNTSRNSRAPVDLVTVLDVSGSMSGTKLALLKRAMGFVIQNLGPSDRLSVIAFSSTARRLFPLRRMSESGRQQSLQAVNSLISSGGTNIAEGLRKGAKVIEERKQKNPVCSIMLLSDGQDTYTVTPTTGMGQQAQPNYQSLVPPSIRRNSSHQVPVHVFGFGADHDSVSLHSISESSSGTFSFIEVEAAIQDAFAQCIGGLLSVVVQEMRVEVKSVHPGVQLGSITSGSYASRIADDKRSGLIDVGDLYADEERDFLVSVNIPPASQETSLLKIGCIYRDPMTKEAINVDDVEVKISRPFFLTTRVMSIEVDRQKNRLQAAEAMAKARSAAENGDLPQAVSILEDCRRTLSESLSGQSGDRLCMSLNAELTEMQERMANRQRYEASGRAYVLSGLSSHSWQRATARGDSTDSSSLVQAYQTPSMVDMLQRSQTMSPLTQHPTRRIRHAKSFPARPHPR
ncbi:E3 ubiquitin-protein ligase WAV3-like [Typha angustifolia]|uniref:E3 ubiquitin-protein ligase WAV3-like n=1 Tax=Typha angustifolia TaxID=59011 RepID=UPI003C2D324E